MDKKSEKKCEEGIVFLKCIVQGMDDLLLGTLIIIIAPDPRN
jgi:hypothetical protein